MRDKFSVDAFAKPNNIRVMLIDDHAIVREGLRAVFEDFSDIEIVAEAASATEALTLAERALPKVIISDVRMPGMPISEAIRRLRTLLPAVQIVVFSSFADAPQVRTILAAGAIGYLTKDARAAELHQAVLAASMDVPCVAPNVRAVLRDTPENTHVSEALARLSPRETSVLLLIAEAKSNKEIARALSLTEGTVKGYVSVIFEKLRVSDRTEAALIALRAGMADPFQ
jgi:DNA-binding NarL/FixJ family response regulator